MKYLFVALAMITLLGLSACGALEVVDTVKAKGYQHINKGLIEYCARKTKAERQAYLRDINDNLTAGQFDGFTCTGET